MDRTKHKKHYPYFYPTKTFSSMYWEGAPTDHNPRPPLNTGYPTNKPIYNAYGNLHFSLPLEDWPPVNDYHKDIKQLNNEGIYTFGYSERGYPAFHNS